MRRRRVESVRLPRTPFRRIIPLEDLTGQCRSIVDTRKRFRQKRKSVGHSTRCRNDLRRFQKKITRAEAFEYTYGDSGRSRKKQRLLYGGGDAEPNIYFLRRPRRTRTRTTERRYRRLWLLSIVINMTRNRYFLRARRYRSQAVVHLLPYGKYRLDYLLIITVRFIRIGLSKISKKKKNSFKFQGTSYIYRFEI